MKDIHVEPEKITATKLLQQAKEWWLYLFARKWLIIGIAFLGGIAGVTYAWVQKPVYKADLTFTPEDNASQLAGYMGIAAQFGIDLGMSGGGLFDGENIMELFKSHSLIVKTLFSEVEHDGKKQTLIAYRIATAEAKNKRMQELIAENHINFNTSMDSAMGKRVADSIVKVIVKSTLMTLNVDKIDKKLNIVKVSFLDRDEFFAKSFVDQLAQNAIDYYTSYKSKKARQNVDILQHQADSVKAMLFGSISDVAAISDLNVNPLKQAARVGGQKKTVDVQVNGAIYTEILKNLELSKIALRKETPFIQIIDSPYYPLEKKKLGRLMGGVIGGFLFGLLTLFVLIFRRTLHL